MKILSIRNSQHKLTCLNVGWKALTHLGLYNATDTVVKPIEEMPGPKPGIFGNFFNLKDFGGEYDLSDYRSFQLELQKKYGDIVKWKLFEGNEVFLFNPRHIAHILRLDGRKPLRPLMEPWVYMQKKLGISSSLINSNEDRWRSLRSAANPVMASAHTVDAFLEKQNEIANDFIRILLEKNHDSSHLVFDKFEHNLRLLSYEFIIQSAFDKRLHCLDERTCNQASAEFVNSVNDLLLNLGKLVFSLPLYKIFPTEDWRKFEKAATACYKESLKNIQMADLRAQTEDTSNTILSHLLCRRGKYNLELTDVVTIMTDLIIGGVDSTSISMHYLLYELGKNPDVQEKIYQELIATNLDKDEEINGEILSKLKYLKHVVKENFRLHTIAPGNSRYLQRDTYIENHFIPKGTKVNFGTVYLTQSERFFKDPLKFDPERWERIDKGLDSFEPYTMLHFGFGARMCIGRKIAEQEIYLTIIKMVQNFKIEFVGKEPGIKCGLLLQPTESLGLKFTKRN